MIEYGGALEAAQAAAQLLVPRSQLTRWHNDPVLFAKECIRWPVIDGVHTELLEYQAQAMGDLVQYGRVAVRAPHAAGKSATNAILVLWFAITRDLAGIDWKCLTTAGAWFHLERALWPEIHLWAGRIRWDVVGREPLDPARELLTTILKLQHGQAFAAATDNPQLIEGLHASAILLILDEAKAIPAPIFDALEGALMGAGEVYALTSSTPEAPSGRFYEICTQQRGLSDWHPIHITLEMAIKAGKIKREMAEQRKLQWGESSSIYQNRVLGEFASQDEDSVIPLAWVEQAMARWRIWHDNGSPDLSGRLVVGVDVADQGDDKTAIALRQGDVVREVRVYSKAEPMETAGYVMAAMESQFPRHDDAVCIIDAIGIGAGVLGRLREQRKQVIAFNPQAVSVRRDRTGSMGFVDQKAEAWWHLREMLDPRPVPDPNNPQVLVPTCRVCLPDTPELIGDLCTPKWKITSQGRIQIESKADIRKRLSRSTDLGDACVQCFVISGANSAVDFTQAAKWREGRDLDPRGIRTAVRYDSGGREVAGHAARGRWGPYGE